MTNPEYQLSKLDLVNYKRMILKIRRDFENIYTHKPNPKSTGLILAEYFKHTNLNGVSITYVIQTKISRTKFPRVSLVLSDGSIIQKRTFSSRRIAAKYAKSLKYQLHMTYRPKIAMEEITINFKI